MSNVLATERVENPQKPTETYKWEQVVGSLNDKHQEVMTLKIKGFTYRQIAERTGYTEQWLRELFAKGGNLHQPYQDFRKQYLKESLDESTTILRANLPNVARALVNTATSGALGSVYAAKVIFEHVLGKPIPKQQPRQEVVSITDLIKELYGDGSEPKCKV